MKVVLVAKKLVVVEYKIFDEVANRVVEVAGNSMVYEDESLSKIEKVLEVVETPVTLTPSFPAGPAGPAPPENPPNWAVPVKGKLVYPPKETNPLLADPVTPLVPVAFIKIVCPAGPCGPAGPGIYTTLSPPPVTDVLVATI